MMFTEDNLVNRYLQAVGFWLPRTHKADILAELGDDLRQQIEDREAELGHSLSDTDVKAILKQRGQPMLVARSFLPQRSLISPVLYPIYIVVLKIVMLSTLGLWLIGTLVAATFSREAGAAPVLSLSNTVGSAWNVAFIQFGILTLIFAAIDRFAAASIGREDWDPAKLARVRPSQQAKRRFSTATELVFGVIGLIWLLAVPRYPFLIVGPAILAVKPAPIWAMVYVSLLVLALAGIAENVVTLLRPDLRLLRPTFHIFSSTFCLWIGYRLLQTHTYVLALDAAAAHYTSEMNSILHLCIAGTMVGFSIALCFHIWQIVKELTQSVSATNVRLA